MSYFEKIGNTISAKSREIARKAKSVSETSSLNNIIRAEQHKIDTHYKMMGKLYFEKYGDSPAEEFSESIASVKVSMKKISETQEQITKIKNRNCCPNCGTQFKIDAVFCSKCGTRVKEEKPEPEKKKCVNCGNVLEADALFCDACGTKIGGEAALPVSSEASSEISVSVSEENSSEKMVTESQTIDASGTVNKICPLCGAESDDSMAQFCNQCGGTL